MLKVLFLDDMRCLWAIKMLGPHCDLTCVYTAQEAIKALKENAYDVVMLDHDLEGTYQDPSEPNTGSEVVRFIAANPVQVKVFLVHTMNDRAWADMLFRLRDAGHLAAYVSFADLASLKCPIDAVTWAYGEAEAARESQ